MFLAAFVVCFVSAGILNFLHFRMKFRLMNAGLSVKWFMMTWDDFRMWRTYLSEAPGKQWPTWPFYAYRALMVIFGVSGIIVAFNVDKLDGLFRRWR